MENMRFVLMTGETVNVDADTVDKVEEIPGQSEAALLWFGTVSVSVYVPCGPADLALQVGEYRGRHCLFVSNRPKSDPIPMVKKPKTKKD